MLGTEISEREQNFLKKTHSSCFFSFSQLFVSGRQHLQEGERGAAIHQQIGKSFRIEQRLQQTVCFDEKETIKKGKTNKKRRKNSRLRQCACRPSHQADAEAQESEKRETLNFSSLSLFFYPALIRGETQRVRLQRLHHRLCRNKREKAAVKTKRER